VDRILVLLIFVCENQNSGQTVVTFADFVEIQEFEFWLSVVVTENRDIHFASYTLRCYHSG